MIFTSRNFFYHFFPWLADPKGFSRLKWLGSLAIFSGFFLVLSYASFGLAQVDLAAEHLTNMEPEPIPSQNAAPATPPTVEENQEFPDGPPTNVEAQSPQTPKELNPPSFYTPLKDLQKPRGVFASPLISFILPGFDQWWEGQHNYASIYTGTTIVSSAFSGYFSEKYNKEKDLRSEEPGHQDEDENLLASRDNNLRKALLGSQISMAAGSFSAFHAFRTAVESRRSLGEYSFLPQINEEKPQDILLAPFQFKYLLRSTTFIPLGVLTGLSILSITSGEFQRRTLGMDDFFFASSFSLTAGTHEEALFRGYLMPVAREYTCSDLAANGISASTFALAHLGSNPRPLPQLALGLYLGYLSQENQWSLGESVFIHAWWDFIIFAMVYQLEDLDKNSPNQQNIPLWLPPLEWVF